MGRNVKVVTMLDEEIKDKLQEKAKRRGLTMSGLIASIIGEIVERDEMYINPLLQKMQESMVETINASSKAEE